MQHYQKEKTFNIKTQRQSEKLNFVKLRLFQILKECRHNNYKLRLFKSTKIYPIVYISFLELIENSVVKERNIIKQDIKYKVKRIIDFKRVSGKPFYLVKQVKYKDQNNT